MKITVRTLLKKPIFTVPKSDEIIKRTKTAEIEKMGRNEKVESQKRSYLSPTGIRIGETLGLNDRDAALAAGYSLSVAQNTKQRIWKPQVRAEWERLRSEFAANTASVAENKSISLDKIT